MDLDVIKKMDSPFDYLDQLIKDHRDQCASNKFIQDKIEDLHRFLTDMKNYCSSTSDTPIHFLVRQNKPEDIQTLYKAGFKELIYSKNKRGIHPLFICLDPYLPRDTDLILKWIKTFIDLNVDIHICDNKGNNVMHIAAILGDVDVIDFLSSQKVDLNKETVYGIRPLTLAIQFHNEAAKQKLESLGAEAPNAEKFVKIREHYLIFGKAKLDEALKKRLTRGGGYPKEFFLTAIKFFETYIAESNYRHLPDADKKFNKILSSLKNSEKNQSLSPSQLAEKLLIGDYEDHMFALGNFYHVMGAFLEKKPDGNFALHLAERGQYLKNFTQIWNSPKDMFFHTSKKINIPRDKLKTVIQLLYQAHHSDQIKSTAIFFSEIPKVIGNPYIDHPHIKQSAMRKGLCYFSNPLALIELRFMQEFGDPDPALAIEMYKDFTIYMREKSTVELGQFITPEQNPTEDDLRLMEDLMEESQKIINEKRNKFNMK